MGLALWLERRNDLLADWKEWRHVCQWAVDSVVRQSCGNSAELAEIVVGRVVSLEAAGFLEACRALLGWLTGPSHGGSTHDLDAPLLRRAREGPIYQPTI